MSTGHKPSVKITIALTVFLVLLSWIISNGISNYLNYLNILSIRQQIILNSGNPNLRFPKPRFGIIEFFSGHRPLPPIDSNSFKKNRENDNQSNLKNQNSKEDGIEKNRRANLPRIKRFSKEQIFWFEFKWLLLRILLAVGLAIIAGVLLGRRFTRPLMQLANGADQFNNGNFDYRIPEMGEDEFTVVASSMNEMANRVSNQIKTLEDDADRRRNFLADVAHELRSPVTTMRTMAGALKDGLADNPERHEKAISALYRTSERLLRLVQELMDISKMDVNEFPLNLKKVDLKSLSDAVIQSYQESNAKISLQLPDEDFKPFAVIDPDRMTQILDNLLANAVEYAGENAEIKVIIEDSNDNIKITVSDNGIGIKAKDLPYIFDSFYRADTARTPGDSHSGLGLSIARKLIEVHGGKMSIESEENKGTDVIIFIPKNNISA